MVFLASFFAALSVVCYEGAVAWEYSGPEGPNYWFRKYPECNGKRQSPIDISPGTALFDPSLQDFEFHGWYENNAVYMKLKNLGKSVQLDIEGDTWIEGGGLIGKYKTAQLHFHWGSQNNHGSEHLLDGQMYPMELHIVHYAERYGNISNALDNIDGLAVLAFFFEIKMDDNPNYSDFLQNFEAVLYKGQQMSINPNPLMSFLGNSLGEYYRYDGSLTTPPCQESVIWTVFRQAIPVSQSQMEMFRQLRGSKQDATSPNAVPTQYMSNNYRPLQPRHGRMVYKNVATETHSSLYSGNCKTSSSSTTVTNNNIAYLTTSSSIFTAHWNYGSGDMGPSQWRNIYKICSGIRQSPIDVDTTAVQYNQRLTDIRFDGYDKHDHSSLKLRNNGYGVQVDVDGDLSINGADLGGPYKMTQFHFHWGSDNMKGSEHTVNGKRYPMEMHIVHYTEKYGNFSHAMREIDGLAVLGVFFEISKENNTNYEPLIAYLQEIKYKDKYQPLDTFPLKNILPQNLSKYYRYLGSLTTPGCYESVLWTLFVDTVKISQAQLNEFRSLYDTSEPFIQSVIRPNPAPNSDYSKTLEKDAAAQPVVTSDVKEIDPRHIVNNFRPVQKLNHRIVYSSFKSQKLLNEDVKAVGKDVKPSLLQKKAWHYEDREGGPVHWHKQYPLCSGERQSPINVVKGKTKHSPQLGDFKFYNWNRESIVNMHLKNKGYTVQIGLEGNLAIEEPGLNGRYKTLQLHFHWGSENWKGSEHTIDGESYPMELHIVHYAAKYGNASVAVTKPDGLAVLGFMFEITERDNPRYETLLQHLEDIKFKGAEKDIKPFKLTNLLPETAKYYYRYMGSLTTPGCQESVIWSLFHETIKISEKQLEAFRSLHMVEEEEYNALFSSTKSGLQKPDISPHLDIVEESHTTQVPRFTPENETPVSNQTAQFENVMNLTATNVSENYTSAEKTPRNTLGEVQPEPTSVHNKLNDAMHEVETTTVGTAHVNVDTVIKNNYRPVQYLYGRIVLTNKPPPTPASRQYPDTFTCGSTTISTQLFWTVVTIVIGMVL